MSASRWDAGIVLAVAAAIGLSFLNKAFHVDDPIALQIAANVLDDPLDPLGGTISYHGWPEPFWDMETNPPLLGYYLAPFAAGSGFSEIGLHAAMVPFLVLLGFAALSLARRFCGSPRTALLFLMGSAGVVVSSNLMRDVPALALATAAVAASVAGTDRGERRLLLLGALLAGLSILTKYSAVVLIAVLALYPVLKGKPALTLWALVPAAMVGLWCLHNQWIYGEVHIVALMQRSYGPLSAWRDNLCGLPVVLGALCFLLPALLFRAVERRESILLAGVAAACGANWWLTQRYVAGAADAQQLFWSISGCALLGLVLAEGVRGALPLTRDARDARASDSAFLLAWLCAPVLFSVVFVPFQAVRHLMPALLPLVLLGLRDLERQGSSRDRPLRALVAGLAALQAALSLAVALADSEFAETYRDFAEKAQARWPGGDHTTWFVGHWGWLHYAERAGMRQVHVNGPFPQPGDRVIIPWDVDKGPLLRLRPDFRARLRSVEQVAYPGRIPIRVMNRSSGSGFYGLHSLAAPGHLPGVPYRFFQNIPVEIFHVYEVR